ncbi:hypothetical protein EDB92DRAFT_2116145 [Lactarius akahatsu]|uniref:Uncharacterized protein n=1 Tax=Lactarius akahatsu TaxID=416441 RepID=A0AAD4QBH4_9AGAM|nr:hypothetical protein EDB92DRAFT_2116145 [Lactarius akahatsu]
MRTNPTDGTSSRSSLSFLVFSSQGICRFHKTTIILLSCLLSYVTHSLYYLCINTMRAIACVQPPRSRFCVVLSGSLCLPRLTSIVTCRITTGAGPPS